MSRTDPQPAASAAETRRRRSPDRKAPRAERVVARNMAVVSIHRRLLGLVVVATALAAVVCSIAILVITHKVPPQYVPIREDGRLLPITPLNQANIDQAGISAFAIEAIHAVNTYDYINWRDQLNTAQSYFVPSAWSDYAAELTRVGTLKAAEERKYIVSVRPNGPVNVVDEAVDANGLYTWDVEVPTVVTYIAHVGAATANDSNRQEGLVRLRIVRVPPTLLPRGIAISSYGFTITH